MVVAVAVVVKIVNTPPVVVLTPVIVYVVLLVVTVVEIKHRIDEMITSSVRMKISNLGFPLKIK